MPVPDDGPTLSLSLGDGQALSYDDVGDPAGSPVVYLHGTPDSRLARHPDDSLVAAAGVRLLAVDRPGYGGTTVRPGHGFAAALEALLSSLGLSQAGLLAWSGGALAGLEAAAHPSLAGRISALTLVAALVPVDAYDDPQVRAGAAGRLGLLEMAAEVPAEDLTDAVATMLAPWPCDHELALEHQRELRTAADQAVLSAIPGAVERLASALVEAVRHGLDGVRTDVEDQIRPFGPTLLAGVTVPVRLLYGDADRVTPVVMGEWYARHLPSATLEVVPGEGHYLPFTRWPELLRTAAVP